jgi:PAS domain S-box-containing protein
MFQNKVFQAERHMQASKDIPEQTSRPDFLTSGGEVGAMMRSMDWSGTKLGPIGTWPQSLKTALSLVLSSRFELFIWWGPDFIMLYNDAYRQTLAGKHPWALGKPGYEVWAEIWNVIGPMLERVLSTGEATWSDDLLLFLERHGYREETYHTFSYSPIRGESGQITGVFTAVTQTTERVIGERRLRTLRDLAARGTDAKSESEAWTRAAEVLLENPFDVPFAALYRLPAEGTVAEAAAYAGITADHPFTPAQVDLANDQLKISLFLSEAMQSGQALELLTADELGFEFPGGAWEEGPCEMLILPLVQGSQSRPLGVLVAAVSRRKRLDDNYRTFFNLLAGQVGKSVADAQAYELQKKRAEALTELDRAKTAFFSNVSHEFRTPLTLMLGPVEDALTDVDNPLPEKQKERLETLQRNALRLLKLVNTLLDFSRLEAGRIQAAYEPTNLPAYTAELASVFRSATERAGIKLLINCSPLPETAYVDREMWEKIVLNLISNAFKFTLQGEIEVRLTAIDGHAELSVRDTGTGIEEHDIAHVFERFRRIQGARGRTHEGTGIGLALVDELVRLHGGSVQAESKPGKGSTFRVRIPLGSQHLPSDRVMAARNMASTAVGAAPYLHEALRWLPNSEDVFIKEFGNENLTALFPEGSVDGNLSAHILLADDNRDMREYVTRLLSSKFQVTAVENGELALESARRMPPDLVLTDVMMPGLDGFGLLKALRGDPGTASIPVVMLSARAGEEARSEGMEAGADDYLVKPFTARELLARVSSHVSMHRFRRELMSNEHELRLKAESAEQQYRQILESISEGFLFVAPDWIIKYVNSHGTQIARRSLQELIGRNYWEAFPETLGTKIEAAFREAVSSNRVLRIEEFYKPLEIWMALNIYPTAEGLSIFFRDITEAKKQAQALLLSEKLAATGRLAATIAHEINNPLEAVINLLYLARRSPHSDPKVQKYLETAEKEMNRVSHIARQTLGFYRDTSTPVTLALPDLLDDVVSVYQSRLRSRNISVQRSYEAASPINGMKGELHQVFSNLVSNAIDAMEAGGVLTLSVSQVERSGKRGVNVTVEDNGKGIREQDLPRLFEPFFTTKTNVGTGLGLWVVKQFVENHHGEVAAERLGNATGPGTRFTIFLPSVFSRNGL